MKTVQTIMYTFSGGDLLDSLDQAADETNLYLSGLDSRDVLNVTLQTVYIADGHAEQRYRHVVLIVYTVQESEGSS